MDHWIVILLKNCMVKFFKIISTQWTQLTTQALTLDIELISIWILRLRARISEDLGAIEVIELVDCIDSTLVAQSSAIGV